MSNVPLVVAAALERHGLLLQHDAKLPSVSALVAGGPVRGSWWGHVAGRAIFAALQALDEVALAAKVVNGKVTWVHERLWPALVGVGAERAPWQVDGLGPVDRDVLDAAEAEDVACDGPRAEAGRTLAARLLVHLREEHVEGSGRHRKVAVGWRRLAAARGIVALDGVDGRVALEEAAAALGGRPPWKAA